MIAYLDSSALVKLLVEEPGSDDVAALWDGADVVVASRIVHPEVCAALAAAHRGQRLTHEDHEAAQALWDDLRAGLWLVEVTSAVAEHAGRLTADHALSGFDAVHLASALVVGTDDTVLANWDRRLHVASREVGITPFPATLSQ